MYTTDIKVEHPLMVIGFPNSPEWKGHSVYLFDGGHTNCLLKIELTREFEYVSHTDDPKEMGHPDEIHAVYCGGPHQDLLGRSVKSFSFPLGNFMSGFEVRHTDGCLTLVGSSPDAKLFDFDLNSI